MNNIAMLLVENLLELNSLKGFPLHKVSRLRAYFSRSGHGLHDPDEVSPIYGMAHPPPPHLLPSQKMLYMRGIHPSRKVSFHAKAPFAAG